MTKNELSQIANVIPINKDSTNLIFIDKRAMPIIDGRILADKLSKIHGADFGAIVFVDGDPNEAAKLISAKDLGEDK